jgi:hypothetical protein
LTQEKEALLKTAERLAKLEVSHRKQGAAEAEFPKMPQQSKALCIRFPVRLALFCFLYFASSINLF